MIVAEESHAAKFRLQAFAPGKVKLNDTWHEKSIFLHEDTCKFLCCNPLQEFIALDLHEYLAHSPSIVLLGTGPTLKIPPEFLRAFFLQRGIGLEFMNSYAACRTYAVLQSEMRAVGVFVLTG